MKKNLLLSAIAVLTSILLYGQTPVVGEYIVILKESYAKPVIKTQMRNNDRKIKVQLNKTERDKVFIKTKAIQNRRNIKASSVRFEYADVIAGFSAKLSEAEKVSLENDPDVEGVYQDYYVKLAPITIEQNPPGVGYIKSNKIANNESEQTLSGPTAPLAIDNTANNITKTGLPAQTTPCGITKAGGFVNGSAKDAWIWILDSGIDLDHPDLNVMTDAFYAKSFVPGAATANDDQGHGTHVAGIAAAKNNTIGVVGVSAGATVVPVKVLNNTGVGQWSWIIAGLNHIAANDYPGDVVNISIGEFGILNCENSYPALRDAIRNLGTAGTYVVMASGNDNGDAIQSRPGCIDGTKVYTVAAISCANTCYADANFNRSDRSFPVDWVAVGVNVYSTYLNGGYATMTGTSMAAPHVAGIIHARGGAPLSAGLKTCDGRSYKIAKR
jgi:subtilisin family serine protease